MRALAAGVCVMLLLAGCGRLDRWFAGVTGGASELHARRALLSVHERRSPGVQAGRIFDHVLVNPGKGTR
jgi:hypothetical protein